MWYEMGYDFNSARAHRLIFDHDKYAKHWFRLSVLTTVIKLVQIIAQQAMPIPSSRLLTCNQQDGGGSDRASDTIVHHTAELPDISTCDVTHGQRRAEPRPVQMGLHLGAGGEVKPGPLPGDCVRGGGVGLCGTLQNGVLARRDQSGTGLHLLRRVWRR